MVSVIVSALENDPVFWDELINGLTAGFSVLNTTRSRLNAVASKAELLIADCHTFESIVSDTALLVFKDVSNIVLEQIHAKNTIAVVNSDNPEAMSYISATKLPAVTCGLSPRDTITLSSIGQDSAVINLQRAVTCLDRSVSEPQEIPVKLNRPIDNFTVMAIASVYILSGNVQKFLHMRLD